MIKDKVLEEGHIYYKDKGFQLNPALAALRIRITSASGNMAALKDWGMKKLPARKAAVMKKTIRNQIFHGLLKITQKKQNMMKGFSHIILKFSRIC